MYNYYYATYLFIKPKILISLKCLNIVKKKTVWHYKSHAHSANISVVEKYSFKTEQNRKAEQQMAMNIFINWLIISVFAVQRSHSVG